MKYHIAKIWLLLAAIATSTASLTPALADPAAPLPPAYNWTGFYVGMNAGYGWSGGNKAKDPRYYLDGDYESYDNGWFSSQKFSKNGSFTLGGQAGYNRQNGNIVAGLEADLNYMNAGSGYSTHDTYDIIWDETNNYHLREGFTVRSKATWLGTVRPRLGFTPVDRLLVYATGGLAFGQVKSSSHYGWRENGYWWCTPQCGESGAFDRRGGFSGAKRQMRWGWTLGAGVEYAVTDRITIKGEYLYADLGSRRHAIRNPQGGNELVSWKDATKLHMFRVGLNYKL